MNDTFLVQLGRSFTSANATHILRNMSSTIPEMKVVLDCRHLEELDGTGLIALSMLLNHLQQQGKQIVLDKVGGQPHALLTFLNLANLFSVKNESKE